MRVTSKADVTESVPVGRDDVFAVLADGWSFAAWVVGASHIREVDDGWPAVGTRIHHSIGPWPLNINDVTEVLKIEPPRLLVLKARLWPLGAARVRLELTEEGPARTRIDMIERATGGAPALVPQRLQAQLLSPRNRESLRRLGKLAEGRARNA